jgi:hypothetical protein
MWVGARKEDGRMNEGWWQGWLEGGGGEGVV